MNQHGLSRDIPAAVAREVRQRCGFGCVVCGCAIIQYHHFDPPYEDARSHDAEGITLLCALCHEREKKGLISASSVARANGAPFCRQRGFTWDLFAFDHDLVAVRLGAARFFVQYPITYDHQVVVGFEPPETQGAPLQLNAILTDPMGNVLFQVDRNEWRVGVEHYDVTTIKNRLEIRQRAGKMLLALESSTGDGLTIRHLDMEYRGFTIRLREDLFQVRNPAGATLTLNCPNVRAQAGLILKSSGGIGIAGSKPTAPYKQ